MRAHQIMTKHIIAVSPHPRSWIGQHYAAVPLSGLPVMDEDGTLRGMVSEGDFLERSEIGTGHKRRHAGTVHRCGSCRDRFRARRGRKVEDVMRTIRLRSTSRRRSTRSCI
ncbi:CBS domain-containing protein [Bradyrhizobium elkanii]|uniref:CBS domain-containing protein n=1 Tax=Bradyrhizobium elkanii TaxID=29448 RepID=UPI0030115ABD